MASTLQALGQVKQNFWNDHANLSEAQRWELWLGHVSILCDNPSTSATPSTPSTYQQTPRSLVSPTSDITHFSTMAHESMAGPHMAPPMARSFSTNAVHHNTALRSLSTFSDWQTMSQEPTNDYTFLSGPSIQQHSPFSHVDEATSFMNDSTIEYNVTDYISNLKRTSSSSLPLSIPQHAQLTPMQWSPSSDGSSSPSTPSTALMTPGAQSSYALSRQSSCNPLFLEAIPLSRNQSDSSCMYPIREDGAFSFAPNIESKPINKCVDISLPLFTGPTSEEFFSSLSASLPASANALVFHDIEPPYLSEDMRRSASASSSEGNTSDASAPSSTHSRQTRREREIKAQASRKIAPRAIASNDKTKPPSSNSQMARIQSDDGSSKTVGIIPKTPYVRPQHPKIMCQFCNDRANGFRGTHELERHVARAHATSRKGYVCVDSSPDKTFLSRCKHCRAKKVYGAYYNAAAHLRRFHFHPRERSKKGKPHERRGGIGGGNDPPMEHLRQHWIEEVEIVDTLNSSKTQPQSPDSGNDAFEIVADNSYDASYGIVASSAASYPSSELPLDASMNTQVAADASQYLDPSMGIMYASENLMLLDDVSYANYDANGTSGSELRNFEFDAYSGMPQ